MNQKPKNEKQKCSNCCKAIPKIGNMRENGKIGRKDWSSRKLHVKCWKSLKEEETSLEYSLKRCKDAGAQTRLKNELLRVQYMLHA